MYPGQSSPQTAKMPDTLSDIWDLLYGAIADWMPDCVVYIERVGTYMPGNSGPSAATFAEHVGALKMALTALRVPFKSPTPAQWEHAFIGKPDYPKIPKETPADARRRLLAQRKTERKNKIKAKAQQLFPGIKVTLAISDALGMLAYAIQTESSPRSRSRSGL